MSKESDIVKDKRNTHSKDICDYERYWGGKHWEDVCEHGEVLESCTNDGVCNSLHDIGGPRR